MWNKLMIALDSMIIGMCISYLIRVEVSIWPILAIVLYTLAVVIRISNNSLDNFFEGDRGPK